uniref:Uncharacterized protein n=1 Tax=viral metagenome TaxID=1070528 RepID=A0A6M3JCU1_9ZZZZ
MINLKQSWLRECVYKALANCDEYGTLAIIDYGDEDYGTVPVNSPYFKHNLAKVVFTISSNEMKTVYGSWIMLSSDEQEELIDEVLTMIKGE